MTHSHIYHSDSFFNDRPTFTLINHTSICISAPFFIEKKHWVILKTYEEEGISKDIYLSEAIRRNYYGGKKGKEFL